MSEMERADKGDGMPKKVFLGQGGGAFACTPTSGGWHLRLSQGSQDECAGRLVARGSPRHLPPSLLSAAHRQLSHAHTCPFPSRKRKAEVNTYFFFFFSQCLVVKGLEKLLSCSA